MVEHFPSRGAAEGQVGQPQRSQVAVGNYVASTIQSGLDTLLAVESKCL